MKGKKTGGRKSGTPNKMTTSAKAAFEFAFAELGGADGLADWARDNQGEFYRLFARLIPKPLELGTDAGALTIKLVQGLGGDRNRASA